MGTLHIFENGKIILIFAIISLLTTADIITTNYVISAGIGYESNELISGLISNHWFYYLKFFLTITVFWALVFIYYDKSKPEVYSGLIALTLFYTIVVLNNSLVIFQKIDLDLNFSKLLLIFIVIYYVTSKFLVPVMKSRSKEQ